MKYIYHLTHIDNLEKILNYGAIVCKNTLDKEISDHVSIAYEGIQKRRHDTIVPIGPGGNLHDYVPFHFAPRSPMLYALKQGNVDSFHGDQERLIYLVARIRDVAERGLDFVFTSGHPIMALSEFFNDLSRLENDVDGSVMVARYWNDTREDPDRKRRRQAEFLIYKKLPLQLIFEIGVYNKETKARVKKLLNKYQLQIDCRVKRQWYF